MSYRYGCMGEPEAQLPLSEFRRLGAQSHQIVQLSLDLCAFGELASCLVQLSPYRGIEYPNTILLDHTLYEFLEQAAEILCGERQAEECDMITEDGMFIGANTPVLNFLSTFTDVTRSSSPCWYVKMVQPAEARDTDEALISVQVQYVPLDCEMILAKNMLERIVKNAMQHRWVMPGTFVMISLTSKDYDMVVIVTSVNESKEKLAYRLGTCDTFCVSSSMSFPSCHHYFNTTLAKHSLDRYTASFFGYDSQIKSILRLVAVEGSSSPSGILIEGCTGVGKSRLLSCLKGILQEVRRVHHISLKELLFIAALSSEETLLKKLLPVEPSPQMILLIDDLDVLHVDQTHDIPALLDIDKEKRLILNCVLQSIDRLSEHGSMTIAVGQSISRLPLCLSKAGRLEKVIRMYPPTQIQRECILMGFLDLFYDGAICRQLSERLASVTGGCVASDLHRLAVDASASVTASDKAPTRYDWEKAAQACLPSQLTFLDVRKPGMLLGDDISTDWLKIHNHGWRTFVGYASLKTRVYRTIVVPWRRRLSNDQLDGPALSALPPPPGVIFHGQSGCGKTLAATCLGSSLGLSMINVRAGDILDKWLGGSEGIMRLIFAKARASAPCILFFDEIDAIASDRGVMSETTDVMSRLLSTMLNEMDGISSGTEGSVLVVACTNRMDSLDKALLRPGRLEEHFEIQKPTVADALEILQRYFATTSLDEELDLKSVAKFLFHRGASAADLEGVVRESAFRSLRRQRITKKLSVTVTKSDVMEAIYALKL